ncbi:MAG TPA: TRAP transporter small permease [Casimicrobiaceae bacterium]
MTRIADGLFYALKIVAALSLALMTVLVFGNVVLRYTASEGIAMAEELSGWALVWITYVAGLVALRENGHLGFDSFVKALPPAGRRACLVVAQLLMIALTAIFLIGGWEQTRINLDTRAAAFDASLAWLYSASILFGVIGLFVLLADLYRTVTGRLRVDELVMVASEGGEALDAAKLHPITTDNDAPPSKRG